MSETIPLGEVVDVSAGQPAPKPNEFSDYGYPFIRARSLESLLKGSSEDDCEKVCSNVAQNRRLKLFPRNTVVFAKSGMSAKIGRVYRLRQPSYVVSHLATLTPTGRYDSSFLMHWLKQHPPSHLINDDAYPSIRVSEIAGLRVPNLPIYKQRRVAAILDAADSIRRKREETIAMVDNFLRTVFLDRFGHPLNPNGQLESSKLGVHCNFFGGTSLPTGEDFTDQNDGLLLLKVSDLNSPGNETVIKSAKLWAPSRIAVKGGVIAPGGAVVFPKRGGAIATNKKRVLGRESVLDPNLMAVVPKADSVISKEYLHVWFDLIDLQTISSGSSVPQLNKKDLAPLAFGVPKRESVKWFSNIYEFVRDLKGSLRFALVEADLLFSSLSQRAFRGEL